LARLIPLALFLSIQASAAVEIHINHSVIRKMLAEQVFTDDGRKYIKATRTETCDYAYLENPEIDAWKGQLRIRARFTGRTGRGFFGRCISLGDSFTAVIYATPYYQEGAIRLRDVRVESADADGFYIRHVRSALAYSLPRQFSYRIYDDAKRILEEPRANAPWKQSMLSFGVPQVHVTDTAVVLVVDFVLDVK
jgi:hypothetical protein